MMLTLPHSNDSNFNVKTAGAMGDGMTDDTAVFQKLLDLAAESQATVEVPPGTYCVGRLKMNSHTGITGSPAYAWKGNGGSTLKLIDPSASCLLDLTLAIGARVNGLCLDGQY